MTLPRLDWFVLQPPSAIYGIGHTARVMVWAEVLSQGTIYRDAVLWAAICHDLRRENDGPDADHGRRAAQWVREELPKWLEVLPEHLDWIASACEGHVDPDAHAAFRHPVLWLLKDADGLDRVRLCDLDPRYFRHQETHDWIESAYELYENTAHLDDPRDIWSIATELKLPVEGLLPFVEQWSRRVVPPSVTQVERLTLQR